MFLELIELNDKVCGDVNVMYMITLHETKPLSFEWNWYHAYELVITTKTLQCIEV